MPRQVQLAAVVSIRFVKKTAGWGFMGSYDQSTVVTLPLSTSMKNDWFNEKGKNGSEKELLTFFNQGLKMDIRPLSKLENSEIEIHYEPQLIKREM